MVNAVDRRKRNGLCQVTKTLAFSMSAFIWKEGRVNDDAPTISMVLTQLVPNAPTDVPRKNTFRISCDDQTNLRYLKMSGLEAPIPAKGAKICAGDFGGGVSEATPCDKLCCRFHFILSTLLPLFFFALRLRPGHEAMRDGPI